MYGRIYKDWDNDRGLVYNGDPGNLKYVLDRAEAEKWYNEHKKEMVYVTIKRPPNLEVQVNIPLGSKELQDKDIDNRFLSFITKGNLSTRMELIMSKFMDNYHLGKDGCFYRRERASDEALKTTRNILALCMMKDIILGCFRITPLKVPMGPSRGKKKGLDKQEFLDWDIGEDFPIEYEVQGSKFKTNLFGVYKPKLFEAMLGDTGKTFNGFVLQRWQLMVWLLSGGVTYVIGPRSGGKCKRELEFLRLADGTFKQAKDIEVGDKLLSSDKKGHTNVVDVQHFQKECVRVTLKDGTDFVVSKDHRIPTQSTYHNGKWDMDIDNYTTAENLVIGEDFVPLMIDNKEFKKAEPLDFERGVLIGMLLGGGSLTNTTPELTCTKPEKREYIYSILDKLGYEYYLGKDKKDVGIKGLSEFRKEYGLYGKSRDKEISNNIFGLSNEFKWGVISGMLWTDGYLGIKKASSSARNKKDSPYIEFASVNKRITRQLRVLMADVGIISYEKLRHKKTHFKDGKEYETDFHYVYVSDKDSLDKINSHCELNLKQNYEARSKLLSEQDEASHKQGNISVIPKCAFNECTIEGELSWTGNKNRRLYNGVREPHYDFQRWKCNNYGIEQWLEYNWNRVESVEDIGVQNVVHIEVDGDHTYWGELDLTHNSLYINGDSAGYLLKELTDVNERIQEFSVLYMGLSQKQNAPYMVYSQKMLNSLIDLPSFCNRVADGTGVYIVDGDKQRKLEYITTNQNDPARSRRTRKFVGDEADYLDWDYVGTALGTADSLVTLISTIGVDTQAGHFYQGWLNAYKLQRDYEPIDVLIHDIWVKYGLHLCTSRKDYERKIKNGDFERMRAEFISRRPEVALHYTMDDVEFLTEQQKETQINKILNARGYDYMLAEYFGEYSTDQTVFNTDGVQGKCPEDCEYWVFGYDEADTYDYPGLCLLGKKDDKYYIKDTWKLSKEPNERFAKMKELIQEYKNKGKPVYLVLDASRGWAAARELGMLGMPVDMLIKWTGNVTYQPGARHNVGKAWCIDMIATSFFDTSILRIDPNCYGDGGLIEELGHFKRWKASARGEKKTHDDQVSGMMLVLYYVWFTDQLGTKDVQKMMPKKTDREIAEEIWAERFQKPKETRDEFLTNLKNGMF